MKLNLRGVIPIELERLAEIYQKLKGSIFLRISNRINYGKDLIESNPYLYDRDEEETLFCLNRDMTFEEWLKDKNIYITI